MNMHPTTDAYLRSEVGKIYRRFLLHVLAEVLTVISAAFVIGIVIAWAVRRSSRKVIES